MSPNHSFIHSLLPGPCTLGAGLALSSKASGWLIGCILVGQFSACVISMCGYWSTYSKHHPGDSLPRIPLTEPDCPDISKWALRCGGWALGLILSFVFLFVYFQISTYLKFHG